jgi:hypothetical protein
MNLTGYRTFIVAGLSFLVPAVAKWGFHFDPGAVADAVIVVVPALMALMRSITHSSPGASNV